MFVKCIRPHSAEGKDLRGYLATVGKSGSDHVTQMDNLLSTVWNQSRGGVLAEPFPGTVTQGVILVLVIVNSQLILLSWLLFTHVNRLEL